MVSQSPPQQAMASSKNPWAALAVLCIGFFIAVMDTTIIIIAIPNIAGSVHAGLDHVVWMINGYVLAYATLLITAGRVGDRSGHGTLFIVGMSVFVLASVGCALSHSPDALVAFRCIQGMGAALLTPPTMTIIASVFPPDKLGTAFGIWGSIAGLAGIVGPILGGVLIDFASWPWVFLINVPLGVVAIIGAVVAVPNVRPPWRQPLEPLGVVLSGAALFLLNYGLVEGSRYHWRTISGVFSIPLVLVVAVLLGVAFVLWDRRRPGALVPASLVGNRRFSTMAITSGLVSVAVSVFFLSLTLMLQQTLHYSAVKTAYILLPLAVLGMLTAPVGGKLVRKLGHKLAAIGTALGGLGILLIVLMLNISHNPWILTPGLVVGGLGMGLTLASISTIAMRNIPMQQNGAASALLNTLRQVGSAIGGAAVAIAVSTMTAHALSQFEALRLTMIVSVVSFLLGSAIALLAGGRGEPAAAPAMARDAAPAAGPR